MALKNRRFIRNLVIEIENISPLHIGAGYGEILIDKESNKAYIPGTTIAGAFKAYLNSNNYDNVNKLFGIGNNMSSVFVYDSFASLIGMELRPSVKINKKLGSAEINAKFERNYIANGHKFTLEIEVFSNEKEENEEFKQAIYSCISALNRGDITLGSFKSSGSGLFKINKIEESVVDLENSRDLFSYLKNEANYYTVNIESINKNSLYENDVTFTLSGIIDTPLLIKGVDQMDSDTVDGEQFKNSEGEYIIPGASLKGIIRNQAEKILSYHNKNNLSKFIFGSENNNEKIASNFIAFDSIIECNNEFNNAIYNRIKIDKFTGGVMKGALMNEKPVMGKVNLNGKLKLKDDSKINENAIATIALTFRDIALGNLSLGSGYNIGRGRIKGENLVITKGNTVIYEYNFKNKELKCDKLEEYFRSLKEVN